MSVRVCVKVKSCTLTKDRSRVQSALNMIQNTHNVELHCDQSEDFFMSVWLST